MFHAEFVGTFMMCHVPISLVSCR